MLAWHFLPADGRLQFEPRTLVAPGQTLRVEGPLVMCRSGLHASVRALDALGYAPGPIVSRVEVAGEVLHDSDQVCARERTCLWLADASQALHEFACWCAQQALDCVETNNAAIDARSRAAIAAKRQRRLGAAANQELAAAWDAARAAASATASAAAWDAAWDAASAAAWDAAWATGSLVAWAAAWDAQNQQLERVLAELCPML